MLSLTYLCFFPFLLVPNLGLFNYVVKMCRGVIFFFFCATVSFHHHPVLQHPAWQEGRGWWWGGRCRKGEGWIGKRRTKVSVGKDHERATSVKPTAPVLPIKSLHSLRQSRIETFFPGSQLLPNIFPKEAGESEGEG